MTTDSTGMPGMTDAETVEYLRRWSSGEGNHGPYAWPTDACGYDQHIRFVHYRNKYWDSFQGTFEAFTRNYADKLERGDVQ
jgi:hypothetical protein